MLENHEQEQKDLNSDLISRDSAVLEEEWKVLVKKFSEVIQVLDVWQNSVDTSEEVILQSGVQFNFFFHQIV